MDERIQRGKQAELYKGLKFDMNDELAEESCSWAIWGLNGNNDRSNTSKTVDTEFVMKQVATSL